MTDHPITPPPELVEDWIELAKPLPQRPPNPGELATLAARWGWDQRGAANEAELQKARDEELEACCKVLGERDYMGTGVCGAYLRAARRPKPPSLKELALAKLPEHPENMASHLKLTPGDVATIRRALNELPE